MLQSYRFFFVKSLSNIFRGFNQEYREPATCLSINNSLLLINFTCYIQNNEVGSCNNYWCNIWIDCRSHFVLR